MKLNEWLNQITTPLFDKKEDADLFTAASALKEIEIPDEVAAKFSSKFMTRERALTDEELVKKFNADARGRVFDSVDLKLKKLMPKLSQADQDAISAEPNTLLKLELFDKAVDNIAKNDDVKKVNEAWRKKEEEFHEKIKSLEDNIKQKDTNFVKQIKDVQIDYAVRNKANAFELAPEFATEARKSFLADSTIGSLKKDFILELDDKDQSIIHLRKNVDGQIVDVFEGNNKVTLDDLLKKQYEPFIKKSAGGDNPNQGQQPKKQEQFIPNDGPKDLNQLMWEAAKA